MHNTIYKVFSSSLAMVSSSVDNGSIIMLNSLSEYSEIVQLRSKTEITNAFPSVFGGQNLRMRNSATHRGQLIIARVKHTRAQCPQL